MKFLVIFLILLVVSMPISYAKVVEVPSVGEVQDSGDQFRDEFGTKKFVYAGTSTVASIEDSGIKYYHRGRLSNRITTDSSGSKDKEFKSLPFGQKVANSGVDYPFTGKEEDESGLYYFGARYYDDNLGRFSGVDPVKENHAYNYVRNNPMNYVDPDGMDVYLFTDHNRAIYAGSEIRKTSPEAMTLVTLDSHDDTYPQENYREYRYLAIEGRWSEYADSISLAGWIPALDSLDIIKPLYKFGNTETGKVGGRYRNNRRQGLFSRAEIDQDIPVEGPVWFDLDLDYFYSVERYERGYSYTSDLEGAKSVLDETLDVIDRIYGDQIVGVSIARSPEYFDIFWAGEFEDYLVGRMQEYDWANPDMGEEWHIDGFSENRQPLSSRGDLRQEYFKSER